MRCHILSDASGAVLAFAMPTSRHAGDDSRFVCKTRQQSCHEIDITPELVNQLRTDAGQILPRLRIVQIDGQARLVA